MIVKELIGRLSKFDGDRQVKIVSKQTNHSGLDVVGAELGMFNCLEKKIKYTNEPIDPEYTELVCVIYGNKI